MNEKLSRLLSYGDDVYGRYAFEFELIKDRISMDDRGALAKQAMDCGEQTAQKLLSEGETCRSIIEKEKLIVDMTSETPKHFNDTLLGLFQYPNKILVLMKAVRSVVEEGKKEGLTLDEEKVCDAVLAHEIFHYLENKDEKNFITKSLKVTTFHLGPIHLKSKVSVLSEIAAMAFAKRLTSLPFSPYVLDYLLMNTIDKQQAEEIYKAICDSAIS